MNDKNVIIKDIIKKTEPKRNIMLNCLKAFFIGGIICLVAQLIKGVLIEFVEEKEANTLSTLSMIFLSSVLTSFGIYDKLGQFAGAGTIIPITGFANSVTSSAIEYKSEGLVTGVINNTLKLAGSIIVVGVLCAFFVSSLVFILGI
jgi:stage V sporulation protein AC